jgi:16S rRNA processing protein RimM
VTTPHEVVVGRIAGVFGVGGELKCDPTSAGRTVFLPGVQLRCVRGSDVSTVRVAAVRPHGRRLLLRIEGVEDADAAMRYADSRLYAQRDQITLEPGEYLDDDLVDCIVEDIGGTQYGKVERVEHYPSSDMLVIGKRMVPLVSSIVKKIDSAQKRIVIDPPAGLLDE